MTMATDEPNRWSWFCRESNNSYGDDLESVEKGNECMVNFATFILHLIFVIIALVILLWRRWCCIFYRDTNSQHLTRWPGHICRWIVTTLLLVCALASIAEGILTEMVRQDDGNPQLQFYLPGCMLFIAIIVSLIYYQFTERWQAPRMTWLLLMYWVFCIISNVWRITLLVRENVVFDAAVLWITVVQAVFFIILLGLELYLVSVWFAKKYI